MEGMAYVPEEPLNKPLLAGRHLNKGEIGAISIGSVKLKQLGYKNDPEGIIGKKVILTSAWTRWRL